MDGRSERVRIVVSWGSVSVCWRIPVSAMELGRMTGSDVDWSVFYRPAFPRATAPRNTGAQFQKSRDWVAACGRQVRQRIR